MTQKQTEKLANRHKTSISPRTPVYPTMSVMKNLELILPFSIAPAGLEKDLLKAMETPSLAKLIATANTTLLMTGEAFSKALAHEYLLAGDLSNIDFSNSPATAWDTMQSKGITPQSGFWFSLQPIHIHFARDHLVLMDQRRLQITNEESRQLFDIAKTVCDEFKMELMFGDSLTWFLRCDSWSGLKTATIDAACGHNIDIWMAQGEHARAWRKLQNEIQMLWFSHPINQQREENGQLTVNSVWLSCGAGKPSKGTKAIMNHVSKGDVTNDLSSPIETSSIVLDALMGPAMNSDWSYWLEQMHSLEKDYFTPLLQALQKNELQELKLICSDARQIVQFKLTPWSVRKFWVKPSLSKLFAVKAV
ncbi:hypothetical protein ACO0K7_00570 [Undibacterium sp. Ji67W]|uniref:hypothetical protein n=1 Tax=Undibacterium sp. Ji67W TaxID=3413042 RepID=UPI003BF2939A